MRMLLLGKGAAFAPAIMEILKAERHRCDSRDLSEGVRGTAEICDRYDLVVLDPSLSDLDRCGLLRMLQLAKVRTPVLHLPVVEEAETKSGRKGHGSVTTLARSFEKNGLISQLRAVVHPSNDRAQTVIRTGKIVVDLDSRAVKVEGRYMRLTPKEYGILELLSRRKGAILTKEMFLDHLYGNTAAPEQKIIDVFVCNLRKKLAAATGGEDYIRTVWGRGYMMRDGSVRQNRLRTSGVRA